MKQTELATVYVSGEQGRATLDFVMEPGTISLDVLNDKLSGTPLNDAMQQFLTRNDNSDLETELNSYRQLYYQAPTPEVRVRAEQLFDSVEAIGTARTLALAEEYLANNADNVLGAYAMNIIARESNLTYSELKARLDGCSDVVKNYQPINAKLEQLRHIEETSAGKHFTDIQGVDGRLSDLIVGRVALVDFYASWCGPCRAEIKDNLVPLYAKYKDKGLVIVGLNVWERGNAEARKAAHEKVMADLGITYPQLVDSTLTATNTYGVMGIPQIMLIDKDGTILARDLRGPAIEEAIIAALR